MKMQLNKLKGEYNIGGFFYERNYQEYGSQEEHRFLEVTIRGYLWQNEECDHYCARIRKSFE